MLAPFGFAVRGAHRKGAKMGVPQHPDTAMSRHDHQYRSAEDDFLKGYLHSAKEVFSKSKHIHIAADSSRVWCNNTEFAAVWSIEGRKAAWCPPQEFQRCWASGAGTLKVNGARVRLLATKALGKRCGDKLRKPSCLCTADHVRLSSHPLVRPSYLCRTPNANRLIGSGLCGNAQKLVNLNLPEWWNFICSRTRVSGPFYLVI